MFNRGAGIIRDANAATEWFIKSANQGYAPAQTAIGWYYQNGKLTKPDLVKAVDWYRRAAAQDDLEDGGNAAAMLGAMHAEGVGLPKDYSEAMKWQMRAAALGNNGAMYAVGMHYEKGLGVAADFGKAVSWYQKAAEAGNQDAKKRIATLADRNHDGSQAQGPKKIPDVLLARCFLEVDVDSITQNLPAAATKQRHDNCLRSNWKLLNGSTPFPLDQ